MDDDAGFLLCQYEKLGWDKTMLSCLYFSPSRKHGTFLLVALVERRVHNYKPNPHTTLHDPATPVRICHNLATPSVAQYLASAWICMRKLTPFGIFGCPYSRSTMWSAGSWFLSIPLSHRCRVECQPPPRGNVELLVLTSSIRWLSWILGWIYRWKWINSTTAA
jgi:hypothetical protein